NLKFKCNVMKVKYSKNLINIFKSRMRPAGRGNTRRNIGILQWEKRRNRPQIFPDSRGKYSKKYRDPPVGEEEKTLPQISPTPREILQEISGSSSGRRGENVPQISPTSRGEILKKYRDPPVGEEEKTSPKFPRLPREILQEISGSSSGRRGKNVPQLCPDSRGQYSNKYRDPPDLHLNLLSVFHKLILPFMLQMRCRDNVSFQI
ncbi:hypothetical protein L9F63_010173, partial [Diploptera punctata]